MNHEIYADHAATAPIEPLRRRKEFQLYDHNLGGKTYKTNNQRNVRRWSCCS